MNQDPLNTPEHELFRETVRKFTEQELRPRAREFDAAGRFDKSLFKKMGDLGMLGLRYDPEYGGAGLDWSLALAPLFLSTSRFAICGPEVSTSTTLAVSATVSF